MSKKIKGLDLYDIGHKLVIEGIVLNGNEGGSHVLMFPDKELNDVTSYRDFTLEDWEDILKQMDTMELEVTQGEKLPKIILRKSQRNIEGKVSWAVFRRDNFTCRYCGDDSSPMTVDHLRLWEEGGPSIIANLVCSCRKCNRNRGNTPYDEWLESTYYKHVSKNLDTATIIANANLVDEIKMIPLNKHKRRR